MVSVQKPWNSIPGFKYWERSNDGIPGWRLLHSFKRDLVGAGTLPGQGCVPSACVLLMTCCPHPYSLSTAKSLALKLFPRAGWGAVLSDKWGLGAASSVKQLLLVVTEQLLRAKERKVLSGPSTQSSAWQFISYRKSCFNASSLRGWEQWCNAQRRVLKFKWTTRKAPALWERMTTQKSEDETIRNRGYMRKD